MEVRKKNSKGPATAIALVLLALGSAGLQRIIFGSIVENELFGSIIDEAVFFERVLTASKDSPFTTLLVQQTNNSDENQATKFRPLTLIQRINHESSIWYPLQLETRSGSKTRNAESQSSSEGHIQNPLTSNSRTIIHRYNRTLTMIVVLKGELCNHLSVLSMARNMQRYIEKELPGIRINMVGEHQDGLKWKPTRRDLYQCFPNQRNITFNGGRWDENFTRVRTLQNQWLGKSGNNMLTDMLTYKKLKFLKKILDQQSAGDNPSVPLPEPEDAKYSLPYLTARGFFVDPVLNSLEAYHDIRSFFQFDTHSCCKARPESGETVFHFRNYISEIKTDTTRALHGWHELPPNETATLLFDDGDGRPRKVAIISRYAENAGNYVKALSARGWKARVVTGQKGVQDFCFAMSAPTLVGLSKSSYSRWAAILGNATLNRWFSVAQNASSTTIKKTKTWVVEGREFWRETYSLNQMLQMHMLTES